MTNQPPTTNHKDTIRTWIKETALSLGFADCGFVSVHHPLFKKQLTALQEWLNKGYAGGLNFLKENHNLRANPDKLVQDTKTIISVRMDYLSVAPKPRTIEDNTRPNHAIIARYARGRDYHKTMRGQLKKLATAIETNLKNWVHLGVNAESDFVFRPFSDSAPIFERPIAEHAGLGWTGKHTLLINRHAGSFFVLGELFISLDLADEDEVSNPDKHRPRNHCGSCTACLDICPTQAIVAPHTVNASACISYLTIEHKGIIDEKYRHAIGNRIFGCDDCQLICPWNRYANMTVMPDFLPRHRLDNISLLEIWTWSENDFLKYTEGSPIRRTGYIGLLRNVAIALGNALRTTKNKDEITTALKVRLGQFDLVDEHIKWALKQEQVITTTQEN